MRRIGGGGVPSGTIQMWSGPLDEIPDGYVLCDGNNGTPDMSDRFVVGYNSAGFFDGEVNAPGDTANFGDTQALGDGAPVDVFAVAYIMKT